MKEEASSKARKKQDGLYAATRFLITSSEVESSNEALDYYSPVRTPRTLLAALSTPTLQQADKMPVDPSLELQKNIECQKCGRMYKLKSSLLNHQRWECGKDPQFKCTLCDYKAKQKAHLLTHIKYRHKHD